MISCRMPPKAQQLIARNVTASDRNTPIVFSKLIKTLTPRENTNPAKGSLAEVPKQFLDIYILKLFFTLVKTDR